MKIEQSFLDRDEYIEHKSLFSGIQYIFETKSGKKISVVRHEFSHGNECRQGLYELADITDESIDVVQRYLTPDDVIKILEEER
ncbi:hypothetical protein [Staphylococcus felis]|uniref:Uncharacterized protein n=1 Tax=Staphylococcus felis TaxID=46127 RepID=A0ABS0QTR2_9STAP|nr:hypothetical protein [Staphylococcus felis]MBH9582140.1 hypothetical protein [Staphylococcus felis]